LEQILGIVEKIFHPRQDKFLALLPEQAQSTQATLRSDCHLSTTANRDDKAANIIICVTVK
jgi:hypothetical protein